MWSGVQARVVMTVLKEDVQAAAAAHKAAAPAAPVPAGERPEQRVPMSRLRTRIGRSSTAGYSA